MSEKRQDATDLIPARPSLRKLLEAASFCRACHRHNDSDLADLESATIHPSSVLRGDPAEREAALQGLADDLAKVSEALRSR